MTCPRPKLEEAVKKKKIGPIQEKEKEVCGEDGCVKKSTTYCKDNSTLIPSAQKTVSPPAPPPTTPPPPELMIIPWGGHTIYNGSALQLINTCPIDNCLMILYALTTQFAKIGSY